MNSDRFDSRTIVELGNRAAETLMRQIRSAEMRVSTNKTETSDLKPTKRGRGRKRKR